MAQIALLLTALQRYFTSVVDQLQSIKDRSQHLGSQPINTIEGLQAELAVKGNVFTLLAAQQIPVGILTKVELDEDFFGTLMWLDALTHRVTVTEPGVYQVFVTINYVLNFTAGGAKNNIHTYVGKIIRNGTELLKKGTASGYYDDENTLNVNYVAQLNGTTDYLELFTLVTAPNVTDVTIQPGRYETTFSILKLGQLPS